jgi:hypothetical protein
MPFRREAHVVAHADLDGPLGGLCVPGDAPVLLFLLDRAGLLAWSSSPCAIAEAEMATERGREKLT